MSIPKNPQVLHVKALFGLDTIVSVEAMVNELMVRVDVVQNCIRISLVGSGENYHLEVLVCFLETFIDVGTHVYSSLL